MYKVPELEEISCEHAGKSSLSPISSKIIRISGEEKSKLHGEITA
jgi:hypothetical protein